MEQDRAPVIPALGKVPELRVLDDYVWATLRGWVSLPAGRMVKSTLRALGRESEADPEALATDLKAEEEEIRLREFTDAQAEGDYPYLHSLVAVRLWAMIEAAVYEVLLEALKDRDSLAASTYLEKLKGPVLPFVGADPVESAELLLELMRRDVPRDALGAGRFEALLSRVNLGGPVTPPVDEILLELSEVRHCVVHRGSLTDRRLAERCPWLNVTEGETLPATQGRYWFYRTATYWYVLELTRRWCSAYDHPSLVKFADAMGPVVLSELSAEWAKDRTWPHGS